MDASLRTRAEELASEMAGQASTVEDLSGSMRQMMKSAMERMPVLRLQTTLPCQRGTKDFTGGHFLPNSPIHCPFGQLQFLCIEFVFFRFRGFSVFSQHRCVLPKGRRH